MNIFEIIPNVTRIVDEYDLHFISTWQKNNGMQFQNIEIGKNIVTLKQNFYVVKPLDTPESVSKALNISKQQLEKKLNGAPLFIGQIIYL